MSEYVEFIEQNLDKLDWYNLSSNPLIIHLIHDALKTIP